MKLKLLVGALLCSAPILAFADTASISIYQSNMLLTMISFFGIGILLAFTPCVLPMIPILSAILVGQEQQGSGKAFRLSLVFVLSMAITYAFAGMLAGYFGSTIQTLMQQPWIIISFSLIFVVMALSMFGYLDLSLPAFLQNRIHSANNTLKSGSYVAVAIMGILSTLIASPCVTAPLLSVLTFISQTGSAVKGGFILFSLALGMGIPLILFGVGQARLLPKTGAWMTTIKNIFGVMILGLAIWMISRILPSNLTLFLWASLFIVSTVAFGALNFTVEKRLPPVMQGISILLLTYGIILLIGAASGHDKILNPLGITQNTENTDSPRPPSSLFTYIQSLPQLEQKIIDAKKLNKPVMIEFFATWCSDCKKVDTDVLSDPNIRKIMKAFTTVRVDISERNPELSKMMQKYNVLGVPTMVFYNKKGELIHNDELNKEVTKEGLSTLLQQLS